MRIFLFCLLISIFPAAAHAVIAQQAMRAGIPANAEYLIGERSLQTREFPVVAILARGLKDAGYIVAGANHLMDGSDEFDLLDQTLKSLDTIQQAPSR